MTHRSLPGSWIVLLLAACADSGDNIPTTTDSLATSASSSSDLPTHTSETSTANETSSHSSNTVDDSSLTNLSNSATSDSTSTTSTETSETSNEDTASSTDKLLPACDDLPSDPTNDPIPEVETNDPKENAQNITGNSWHRGAISQRDTPDIDYFAFDVSSSSYVNVVSKPEIGGGKSNQKWHVSIRETTTDVEVLSYTFNNASAAGQHREIDLPAGSYYALIQEGRTSSIDGWVTDVSYLFALSTAPCDLLEQEPNDDKSARNAISFDYTYRAVIQEKPTEDFDNFGFVLTQPQALEVELRPEIGGGASNQKWYLALKHADTDEELLQFTINNVSGSGQRRWVGLPSGSYYLAIEESRTSSLDGWVQSLPYLFDLRTQSDEYVEQEPNNDKVKAQPIELDRSYFAALQNRTVADIDLFSFAVDESREISLAVAPVIGGGSANQSWYVVLREFSTDNEILNFAVDNASGAGVQQKIALGKGQYYVSIQEGRDSSLDGWVTDIKYTLAVMQN